MNGLDNSKSFTNAINRAQYGSSAFIDKGRTYSKAAAMLTLKEQVERLCSDDKSSYKKAFDRLNASYPNKTRDYVEAKKSIYSQIIQKIIYESGIHIDGLTTDSLLSKYIEEVADFIGGLGKLEAAFSKKEEDITDIHCIKWDTIFVEKDGKTIKYPYPVFESESEYNNLIDKILRDDGKELNSAEHKVVDFNCYGDRGCAIVDGTSYFGRSLTLRKHNNGKVTRDRLVEQGVLTSELADLFGAGFLGGLNIVVAGITGSGKTTTMSALINHYSAQSFEKIVSIEDTFELYLKSPNLVSLQAVNTKDTENKYNISLRDLVKTALRLKPKHIVIGEVRGEEAVDAIEAGETGHQTTFSLHADSTENVITRATTKYLMGMPALDSDTAKEIVCSGLDLVFIQDDTPGFGRKITEIAEVTFDGEKPVIKTIAKYVFEERKWVIYSGLSHHKIYTMMRRGVSPDKAKLFEDTNFVGALRPYKDKYVIYDDVVETDKDKYNL